MDFAHSRLIDLFFVSIFDTTIFHHDIVDCVACTRCWPSPLRMVQSLQASMALAQVEPYREVHVHQEIHTSRWSSRTAASSSCSSEASSSARSFTTTSLATWSARDAGPVRLGWSSLYRLRWHWRKSCHVGTFTGIAKFVPHCGVRAQLPHRLALLKRLRHRGPAPRHRRLRGLREMLARSAQDGPVSADIDVTSQVSPRWDVH